MTSDSLESFISDVDTLLIKPRSQCKPTIYKVLHLSNPGISGRWFIKFLLRTSSLLTNSDNRYKKTDGWFDIRKFLGCAAAFERNKQMIHFGLQVERF